MTAAVTPSPRIDTQTETGTCKGPAYVAAFIPVDCPESGHTALEMRFGGKAGRSPPDGLTMTFEEPMIRTRVPARVLKSTQIE